MKNLKRKIEIVLCLMVLVPALGLAMLLALGTILAWAQTHAPKIGQFILDHAGAGIDLIGVVLLVATVLFLVYVSRNDPVRQQRVGNILKLSTLIPLLYLAAFFGLMAYRNNEAPKPCRAISPPDPIIYPEPTPPAVPCTDDGNCIKNWTPDSEEFMREWCSEKNHWRDCQA